MGTVSTKFYKVRMPDGQDYATIGSSIKKVALTHGIPQSKVTFGVDLLKTPDISDYYKKPLPYAFIRFANDSSSDAIKRIQRLIESDGLNSDDFAICEYPYLPFYLQDSFSCHFLGTASGLGMGVITTVARKIEPIKMRKP